MHYEEIQKSKQFQLTRIMPECAAMGRPAWWDGPRNVWVIMDYRKTRVADEIEHDPYVAQCWECGDGAAAMVAPAMDGRTLDELMLACGAGIDWSKPAREDPDFVVAVGLGERIAA
jgi:hypothetical protein